MLKKSIFALLLVGSHPAFAETSADQAWNGAHAGITAGYGESGVCWFTAGTVERPAPAVAEGCQRPDGVMLGGQIGYDIRIAPRAILGVEIQGGWTSLKGSGPSSTFPSDLRDRIDAFGLATSRLGYTSGPALVYVKAGAGFVKNRLQFQNRVVPSIIGDARQTRWGPVLGLGAEFSIAKNLTAGIEIQRIFLGSKNAVFSFTTAVNGRPAGPIEQSVNLVGLRLNWAFGR